MTGAARFLNNLYGNLVGTINGFTVEKSVPSNAVFTDTKYTAATAAPGKVASSSSQGSSTNYARQDHTHGIDLATGDSNGQVKIAGTNVSVKGLGAAAYMGTGTSSSTVALGNHTHNYAGSSSAGGSANSAVKLDSTSVGSASCPVYFSSEGKPVAVTTTAAAASGGTALTVVTTGEKYTWNNKSNLTIGTSATTAAAGNHTHNDAGSSSAGGSANSAVKLSTSRLISVDMSKAASSGTSFDGSAAVDIGVKNQLGVGNGGTGASTLTSKGILYGNGTSAIGATTAGTSGQLLKSQGSSGPTWTDQSAITAGKATKL